MRRPSAARIETDYYKVLRVLPTATQKEIRAAFRALLLEAHPDKNPERREWSERRSKLLIEAYEVLSSERSRAAFDRGREQASAMRRAASARAAREKKVEPFFFRKDDPESRALLILYLLLHRRGRQAARVLAEMESRLGEGFLAGELAREDYLDCLFLLGEFHAEQGEYEEAARRLEAFHAREKISRNRRHYSDEALRRLKDIYLRKLPRRAKLAVALRGLEKAASLPLTPSEEALRWVKMAQLLARAGDGDGVRKLLDRARGVFGDSKVMAQIEAAAAGVEPRVGHAAVR
jgi:curved DNA-binding protein CbpA